MTQVFKILYIVDRLFSKDNELSPDLEWMLQSDQVDDETIVDFLVREYYSSIHNLASSSLTYPKHADRATKEIFFRVVHQAKDYPPDKGINEWLNSIAVEETSEQQNYMADQRVLNARLIKALLNQRSH